MWNYQVDFDSPAYLVLLALLPALWWFSYRSLAGLGSVRRLMAIGARSVLMLLVILALAEMQLVRSSDRLTVFFLLDQSLSIPAEQRSAMRSYVNAAISEHRKQPGDRAAVIVFGREAAIEIPPFDDEIQLSDNIEVLLDPEYTNLASAMRLAQASFPEDSAKRIVVVSDGNENLGDALEQARSLVQAGVGIDVHPVKHPGRGEVIVEKLTAPPEIRRGQPYDLRVVAENTTRPTPESNGDVTGQLVVTKRTGDQPVVIARQRVTLEPGRSVHTIRQEDVPDFYTYEAQFIPDDPTQDQMPQNNRATAFTLVRGTGRVLLVEDYENPGEHDTLIERLRQQDIEVSRRTSERPFDGLAELQQYDSVILANTPREHFTEAQIQMLVRNTEQLGCGLIMLGGPNSFGAGGWNNTELEKAMPVDFDIKSAKVIPKGALALIMHASEIPQGNFWQKKIAAAAIEALGSEDYCGLLHYDGSVQWLWFQPDGFARVGPNRTRMLARVNRMTPGDMPDFDPALVRARRGFSVLDKTANIAVKHMIVISDGDPTPPSAGAVRGLRSANVTVSTVAVGAHGPAGSGVLQKLAADTNGKYYSVRNPNTLPKIFQREARRVARPLVYEKDGLVPRRQFPHEILSGIGDIPPISGFVLTTVKQNPLVEVSLVSPEPLAGGNNTLLASWTYGLGRSVAFTTDVGARFANDWTAWSGYDKLFSQMVRWSMRPQDEEGKFTVASDVRDGKVRMFVTALDKDDEFLNFLSITGTVVDPEMQAHEIKIEQTAPGRYEGSFDAESAGTYFAMLNTGAGGSVIRTGVNVPYSPEFRERVTDEALMMTLAHLTPRGGQPGEIVEDPTGRDDMDMMLVTDPFRHDLQHATSSAGVWHLLVFFGGCLFFCDVFIRRVAISFAWVPPLAAGMRDRLLRREREPDKPEYMQRLRSRKAEVADQIEQRRAGTRFEPQTDAPATGAVEEELSARPAPPPPTPGRHGGPLAAEKEIEEESYTERLLKAKQKVWEKRQGKDDRH